ncbi:MAG: hypothetical protein HRT88_22455 [Lentisphaeraceae bacterium]|nr:hypothetical protein [Lentisphaeraceae bacterium]
MKSKELTRDIPVIFLTARNDRQSIEQGFEVGGEDYVNKPFCKEELLSRIKAHLALKRQRDDLEYLVQDRTEELQKAKLKAEESDRMKSAFLANISHEIRTPMNAIIGFAEIIDPHISSDKLQIYKKLIRQNSSMLLKLIGDILEISRIEAGRHSFDKGQCDLIELLDEQEKFFRYQCEDKGLSFTMETSGQISDLLSLEQSCLRQVLFNILSNAVKFTEKGFVKLTTKIVESNDDVDLTFEISDSGSGMPLEERRQHCGLFEAGSDTASLGLGLSIVKRLLKLIGGEIECRSGPQNCGTSIIVTLSHIACIKADFLNIKTTSKPSDFQDVNWQQGLIELVEYSQRISSPPTFNDIRDFAEKLNLLTDHGNSATLDQWFVLLNININAFDMSSIEQQLHEFPDFINTLLKNSA